MWFVFIYILNLFPRSNDTFYLYYILVRAAPLLWTSIDSSSIAGFSHCNIYYDTGYSQLGPRTLSPQQAAAGYSGSPFVRVKPVVGLNLARLFYICERMWFAVRRYPVGTNVRSSGHLMNVESIKNLRCWRLGNTFYLFSTQFGSTVYCLVLCSWNWGAVAAAAA